MELKLFMSFKIENLKRIEIKNLLYKNRYILDFENNSDSLIILHGENGCGKTTLLNLIDHLIAGRYSKIRTYKFSEIEFIFSNQNSISFIKDIENNIYCRIYQDNRDDPIQSKLEKREVKIPTNQRELENILAESKNWISIYNDDRFPFRNIETEELIRIPPSTHSRAFDRILEKINVERDEFVPSIEHYFSELNSYFIRTNRLFSLPDFTRPLRKRALRSRRINLPHMKTNQPLYYIIQHLVDAIEFAYIDSSRVGRQFDNDFFDLLLLQVKQENPEEEIDQIKNVLKEQLEKIDSTENELIDLGIYEETEAREAERAKKILQEDEETISKMYDAIIVFNKGLKEKFSKFDTLKNQVSLFTDYLNDHLKGKRVKVTPRTGFQFVNEDGDTIFPWQLSSGEQHIVLLGYFLVFLASTESLILIDEPELSLHLKWQRKFLKNILNLTKSQNIKFLVATHSPAISTPYEENMISLSVGDQNE